MKEPLNPSASGIAFLHILQNHQTYGDKKISLPNIQSLLNFTTRIPNSKLINVAVENLKFKKDSFIGKEITGSLPLPRSFEETYVETEYPTILPMETTNFENLIEVNVETESSVSKDESVETFVTDVWIESSDMTDNSEENFQVPTEPTVITSDTTNEINYSEARTRSTLDADLPHKSGKSDVLLQTSLYELSTGPNEVVITTTRRGMEIDITDKLNPNYIAKATNYHSTNSHLSTVTRSATVLAEIVKPHVDLTDKVGDSNITIPNTANNKPINIGLVKNDNRPMITVMPKISGTLDYVKQKKEHEMLGISGIEVPHTDYTSTSSQPKKASVKIQKQNTSQILVFPSDISDSRTKPQDTNGQNSQIETKNPILTEEDASHLIQFDFSSSVILSVGISCAFALLLFVIISLWLLKRNKYRSKVYLSYELAKPRTHITKPMRPSVLPGETIIDNMVVDETESPREPLYLDQEINANPTPLHSKYSISMESCDSGIDNLAFTDASSSEGQRPNKHTFIKKKENPKTRRPTPKYIARKKRLLVDSSLKVCSSDGSIFPASPSLTKCLIPPPPYSPNIKNDSKLSLSHTIDSSNKNAINSISEVCEHLPSQSSTVK